MPYTSFGEVERLPEDYEISESLSRKINRDNFRVVWDMEEDKGLIEMEAEIGWKHEAVLDADGLHVEKFIDDLDSEYHRVVYAFAEHEYHLEALIE